MFVTGLLHGMGIWLGARLDHKSARGASAIEYAIMVAMIAAVIILAVVFLGDKTSSTFSCTAKLLQDHSGTC
jgi:pilus assembly protein Flp/PilA